MVLSLVFGLSDSIHARCQSTSGTGTEEMIVRRRIVSLLGKADAVAAALNIRR